MAGFARSKRVTDPLDDKVKARIICRDFRETASVSSGSEHNADNKDDASPSLSGLLCGFLYDDFAAVPSPENDSDSERDHSPFRPTDAIDIIVNPTVLNHEEDAIKSMLVFNVSKAVELFSCLKSNKPSLRRNVMAMLRDLGYNAAICKTKWQSSPGLSAGNYEFIDVVSSDSGDRQTRYFVDLDFAGEFEIARQSNQYERQLQNLPSIFIGKNEELRQIVKFMSEAAKRSLKSRGLHLPPWRTNRYMQNKWFGSNRRTTALVPANSLTMYTAATQTSPVKCRYVGFDAVKGSSFIPAVTRTR